jgi:hypothetical protein
MSERDMERPADDQERPDVRDAMATYAGEGKSDDASGGDASAGARHDLDASVEGDREPHGPA